MPLRNNQTKTQAEQDEFVRCIHFAFSAGLNTGLCMLGLENDPPDTSRVREQIELILRHLVSGVPLPGSSPLTSQQLLEEIQMHEGTPFSGVIPRGTQSRATGIPLVTSKGTPCYPQPSPPKSLPVKTPPPKPKTPPLDFQGSSSLRGHDNTDLNIAGLSAIGAEAPQQFSALPPQALALEVKTEIVGDATSHQFPPLPPQTPAYAIVPPPPPPPPTLTYGPAENHGAICHKCKRHNDSNTYGTRKFYVVLGNEARGWVGIVHGAWSNVRNACCASATLQEYFHFYEAVAHFERSKGGTIDLQSQIWCV